MLSHGYRESSHSCFFLAFASVEYAVVTACMRLCEYSLGNSEDSSDHVSGW